MLLFEIVILYSCFYFPASLLLDNLLCHLTDLDYYNCKAIYLHVLTTNQTAISFYKRRNFTQHSFLPYYYSIQGSPRDGYAYVLYINGGEPPWTILDYVKYISSSVINSQPCAIPKRLILYLQVRIHARPLLIAVNRGKVYPDSGHQNQMSMQFATYMQHPINHMTNEIYNIKS